MDLPIRDMSSSGWCYMLTVVEILMLCVMMFACEDSSRPNTGDEPSAPTVEDPRRVLRDPDLLRRDPDRVVKAMQQLGERRAVEAIPELTTLLGFRYWYDWEKERPIRYGGRHYIFIGSRYPATSALFQIGKPALPALLKVVETHHFDAIESRNARYTIRVIFRDEPPQADMFFKEAAAKASTDEAKQRLLKSIESAEDDMKLGKEDLPR